MSSLQIPIIVILIIPYLSAWQHFYNLYNTDQINRALSHDCIYYTINDQREVDGKKHETRQIIHYCIRLSSSENYNNSDGQISSILTFDQMKNENVSVKNLVKWSSPIDLIERYQIFLQMNNYSSTELFYNCTVPWFGPFCQYRFAFNSSFSEIVNVIFNSKQGNDPHANFTCYTQMKCNRGSPRLCLDWREICDGKIDCIDDGEDEKHCYELRTNQCADGEYQCRNGMCIDEKFLLEAGSSYSAGYECLDQSDESLNFRVINNCLNDPSFRCEDTVCPFPINFNCGDGNCVYWPISTHNHACSNGRDRLFNYEYEWHNQEATQFSRCFKIALCASNVFLENNFDIYCKKLCTSQQECVMTLEHCPSSLFAPDFPVWGGHIRLGYFSHEKLVKKFYPFMPHFVCYDRLKCPFLIPTFEVDNYTCIYIKALNLSSHIDLYMQFIPCIHVDDDVNMISCSQSSMLNCLGTKKCIPKRYVMDTVPDCYDSFDESIQANSCLLNDKYRFRCTSEEKCLSPNMVNDYVRDCIGAEDEFHPHIRVHQIRKLPFSALCDGRIELVSSIDETDESNCEHWPCVNQYTRCNGVWNCPKGIDEINCPSKFSCPTDHHPCIFPKADIVGCLHINRTEDGIIDCLGATDERTLCRHAYPKNDVARYRCWNDSKCVDYLSHCFLCSDIDNIDKFCETTKYENLDIIQHFQSMYEFYLVEKLPFSCESSSQYPDKSKSLLVKMNIENHNVQVQKSIDSNRLDSQQAWLCNRGILIYYGKNENARCLCPPSYYGNRCQYQNQRVSLTVRFQNEHLNKLDIISIVMALMDDSGSIHSYEQFIYMPILDCNTKFNIYLLYRDRPKNMTKNYTIRIDAYDKVNLVYLTTWTLPVKFLFMPVNRISAQLTIPTRHYCKLSCGLKHHQQKSYAHMKSCQCDSKTFPITSINQDQCNCSPDSICVGIANNRSICICPLTKMSPRCFLESICQKNICMNGGLCVPLVYQAFTHFRCVCQDGYSGERCEHKDVQINISFSDISISQSILIHFITVHKYDIYSMDPAPLRSTMFKKVGFHEEAITLFMSLPFHIVFTQIQSKFYLTILQHNYTRATVISTKITRSQYCPHIRELFNKTITDYPVLRRVKYYHLLCMKDSNPACFQDSETFLCLCTIERHANCFHFDFNMTYNCMGSRTCQNGAQCFQDDSACPTKRMCVCRECFYGAQCQFNTQQFGLSLDAILGYQIRPHLPITKQGLYVIISIAIVSIMLIVGSISGILSILTFHSKPCQKIGCGIYLTASSITSILTITALNFKLWFLILSQTSIITSRSFLVFSCISMEFILRSLLAITDWFHACVAIERLVTVVVAINFNLLKSKKIAKILIFAITLITTISLLHDPMNRRLIYDEEEKRTWCVIHLTSSIERFNSFINIFHFITPFSLKVISAISIIIFIAKKRALIKTQQPYIDHIKQQFYHHKHLIISSSFLVVLALPRLIFSFSFGCMKSAREPLLFLIGYFVSFIPSLLIFFIFVSTSKTYEQEFKVVIRRRWNAFRRRFSR